MASNCENEAYATLLTEHANSRHESTFLSRARARQLTRHHLLELVLVLARSLRRVETPGCRRDFLLMLGDDFPLDGAADSRGKPSWPRMRGRLESEGVVLRRVAPVVRGLPAADKLAVWNLTAYRRVLFADADVLALQSVGWLFKRSAEQQATGGEGTSGSAAASSTLFAHHPYDMVQGMCVIASSSLYRAAALHLAYRLSISFPPTVSISFHPLCRCGIPLEQRAQTALMLAQPHARVFRALQAALTAPPYVNATWHLQHYSEQSEHAK